MQLTDLLVHESSSPSERACPDKLSRQEGDRAAVGVQGFSEASLGRTSLILNTLLHLLQSGAPVHWEEIKMSS